MARRRKREPKPDEVEGNPGEMRELGESISGTQPEIGHKDLGLLKQEEHRKAG